MHMLQHTVELASLLVGELGTCIVGEAQRRRQRRYGRGQNRTTRSVTIRCICCIVFGAARTGRAMGIASFVRVACALGLGWGVVLHTHVLCECIRARERLVTLGPWARKGLLARVAAQVAQ